MVDGRLLQMNKSYGQLKQKQKEKISEWMYQAYRKQTSEKLSDEEALQLVFDRIEEAKIWIPDHEIINRYRAKKNQFRKRLAGENVPQHIFVMESILEKATQWKKQRRRWMPWRRRLRSMKHSRRRSENWRHIIQARSGRLTLRQMKQDSIRIS